MSSSTDGSSLNSALESREAPKGKLYAIGYFEYRATFRIHASIAPFVRYHTETAIFVPEHDPLAVCQKPPRYISLRNAGEKPNMPQNLSFMNDKNSKCVYTRKDRGSAGEMFCQDQGFALCSVNKVVARDCAKKGKEAIWRQEKRTKKGLEEGLEEQRVK
ncbi:MAG: hypothetical protein Q9169_008591 [Polycauliona sp. 2 TL-2023]